MCKQAEEYALLAPYLQLAFDITLPDCLSTDMHVAVDMHIQLIVPDWATSLTSSKKCNTRSCCTPAYLLAEARHVKANSHSKQIQGFTLIKIYSVSCELT